MFKYSSEKIAQVVCTFPPYRGGLGNVAYHLSDHLSRLGREVTVFTPRYRLVEYDFDSFFKLRKLLPQFKYGNAAVVLQLFWHLFKYQIVHLHYPFLGGCLATALFKLFRGKKAKLIFHYHMDLVGRNWKSCIYKIYNFIYLPWLVRLADTVIVTSEDYLKTSLLAPAYQKYQAKFKILPNGVDINYFKPQAKDCALITKHDLTGKKVILFVGALDSAHYFKGVNYLIKAVEMMKRNDFKLIIVGEGDLRRVYEDMVDSYNLRAKVIFTGYVLDEELANYYNLCDIFVLPSIDQSEAFGMVLLEAMACAKPVVASNLPGVREVVEKRKVGRLVRPKDVANLAEHLTILLDQPKLAKEYGQAGRQKVEQQYSWQKIVEDLLKIYYP